MSNFSTKETNTLKVKIYILIAIIIVMFSAIFIRMLFLVFYNANSLKNNAYNAKNFINRRANIFDRNLNMIATNTDMFSLFAKPNQMQNPKLVTEELEKILDNFNYEQTYNLLNSNKDFVWVKKDISIQEKEKFLTLGGVRDVYLEQSEKRIYPYSNLLSHVLGFVGTDMQGFSGIERFIDKTNVKEDIILSIDIRMQIILNHEIEKALLNFESKAATGIIVNPNTGEILALVNKPDFNPNDIKNLNFQNLFNYATQSNIEIGSCMKTLTFAIAIDTETISNNTQYELDEHLKIGSHLIQDHKKMNGKRDTSFIFKNSSNIGTTKIAFDIGKENFYFYLEKLGLFNKLVNLELFEKSFPQYTDIKDCKDINFATMSYGYGISYSPLHLVNAYIPIVNGGMLYNTTFFKKDINQLAQQNQIFKKNTSEKMKKFLQLSVLDGTSTNAKIPGYSIGGKTGTSFKNSQGKYHKNKKISSFIGIMPVDNPQYLVLVVLDEPQANKNNHFLSGAAFTAAPLAKNIFEKIIILNAINSQAQLIDNKKLLEIDFQIKK